MSKKKKQDELVKNFLVGEIYKAFNQHPNKTFNHKQLLRIVKSELTVFADTNQSVNVEILNNNLKKEIIFLLAELQDKGDVIEVDYGKFKLKPKHAYME